MLPELWSRRELILSLVRRDLKIRYKASVLGFLWSFCKPLLLMLVLYVVFAKFVPIRFQQPMAAPFALFLLSGILAWTYLAGCASESLFAILGNASLVKKTYIPPEVFPVVTILSNLFHFLLALLVYFGLVLLFAWWSPDVKAPTWHVLFLPFVIALHTFFLFGLVLLLSAVNVFFRDIASIMEVLLTAWFYLSPILYPLTEPYRRIVDAPAMPDWLFHLYMLNPMAPILAAYRKVLLLPAYGDVEFPFWPGAGHPLSLLVYLGVAVVTSALLVLIGQAVFRHYAGRFADEI